MFENFEAYITKHTSLTRSELDHIRQAAIVRKVRKRQLLVQEGEICRYKIFVTSGLLFTYLQRADGSRHVLRFAPENTWTTAHESYRNQTPSRCYIEALEDTEVILWTRDNVLELMDAIPAFKAYSDDIIVNNLDASQNRILMNIAYSSEEKYDAFVEAFPTVFPRLPLHLIASYLGVSRETLSRIRHARSVQLKK